MGKSTSMEELPMLWLLMSWPAMESFMSLIKLFCKTENILKKRTNLKTSERYKKKLLFAIIKAVLISSLTHSFLQFMSLIAGKLVRYSKIAKRFESAAKSEGVSGDSGSGFP